MHALIALPVAWLAATPAQAGGVARITTESAEYCEELAARLAGLPKAEDPVPRALGEEGRRLCASGHVRTGIARLRRAIRAAQVQNKG
ncbi:MAG: hypothetical protein ACK44F_07365 [Roseococcus sp.]|jgi:hypothetical protein